MKVTLTQKKIFEVKAPNGKVWRMEQAGDSWNGLTLLKTEDGETLIVCPVVGPITEFMTKAFDLGDAEYYVVKGSPTIIAALSEGE